MFDKNTRILIIDDMPTIRDMVRTQLKQMGFHDIVEEEDAKKGLIQLERSRQLGLHPFGLVICDWNMPNMTGVELLKVVRADDDWKQLPFVLVTSESEREQVTEAIFAGVSQYIVKPFSQKTFVAKLQAAYDKHKSS